MSAKRLITDAAAECGWDETTQISVLCDFIDQMNKIQPNFSTYLDDRVDEEFEDEESPFYEDDKDDED